MKTLLLGIYTAVAIGMVAGAAMQPNLDPKPSPTGPQMYAGDEAERVSGPFEETAVLASFNGPLPDHVLGTDLKKAQTPPAYEPEPEPRFVTYNYYEPVLDAEPTATEDPSEIPAEAFTPAEPHETQTAAAQG